MLAARKAEQSVQKKYYNRTAAPKLYVVPDHNESERMERQAQKASRLRLESLAQTATLIMACILIGAISVAGYERLTDISLKIDKVKKEIVKTEKRIDTLDVQIACAVDISNVMDVAVDQLGMNYPQKEQIVQLDGVNQDAPVREAVAPSAAADSAEDETVRMASAAGNQILNSATTEDGLSSPDQTEAASLVPSYAAAAVRITDVEVPPVSSPNNSLLALPQ